MGRNFAESRGIQEISFTNRIVETDHYEGRRKTAKIEKKITNLNQSSMIYW